MARLAKGSYALVLAGIAHDFANEGTEPACFLAFNLPAGFEAGAAGIEAIIENKRLTDRSARPL